jgi:hypothetical protein
MPTKCPYCKSALDVKPSRKKKCPNCGEYIYVRKGKLVTEEDAKIGDWLERVSHFRITKKTFLEHRESLSKQFKQEASINDTAWRILNLLIRENKSHFDIKLIYLEMAHIVSLEGKNPKPYLAEAAKQELLELKAEGAKKVKISTLNDYSTCKACSKLEGKVYTIDQALFSLPIPNLCENVSGCRCSYSSA